jgi:hemoglobin
LEDYVVDDLYDLIDGKRTIQAATEAFYRKVYADDTLRPFFKTTDMAQLLARQSMFVSMIVGGQVVYTGRDIHAAHAHAREQGLNDGHFDRFLRHFREALTEQGVEADKVEKVLKLLEGKRSAVLNP